MRRLFSNSIKSLPFSHTKSAALLRGINQVRYAMGFEPHSHLRTMGKQEIVFPVIRELRDTLYDKFPFKDVRG